MGQRRRGGEGRRGEARSCLPSAAACHTVSHGASSHRLPLFLYQRLLISDSLNKPPNWWGESDG